MIDSRRPYSVASLAERWSCSDQTVRNLIKSGKLASFSHGNLVRISAAEVDLYEGNALPARDDADETSPQTPEYASKPLREPPLTIYHSYSSKLPDWPGAMKRKTAAAYLDLAEAALERDVAAGTLPPPFLLGGRPHWRKEALDKALAVISGDWEPVPDHIRRFEERRRLIGQ